MTKKLNIVKSFGAGDILCHDSFQNLLDNLDCDGEHRVNEDENPYHLYIRGINLASKYIVIGFTGAVSRKRSTPPYFSFLGVSNKIGLGVISISDPSLDLVSDLGLSWYVGNRVNGDVASRLASFLDSVIDITGKQLILSGGSGGGFAALNIQRLMRNKHLTTTFVWNPQTDITKYNNYNLYKYLSSCYLNEEKSLVKIREFFKEENIKYKVEIDRTLDSLIFINGYDPNHIRKQIRRFISFDVDNANSVYVGDWGNGHVKPPKELIVSVLEKISQGMSAREITNQLHFNESIKQPLIFSVNGAALERHLNVRSSIFSVKDTNLLVISCNIYDFFTGYNIKINIINESKIIYSSNYLLGIDVAEVSLEFVSSGKIYLRNLYIELVVEDLLGYQKNYKYNLAVINTRKMLKGKI